MYNKSKVPSAKTELTEFSRSFNEKSQEKGRSSTKNDLFRLVIEHLPDQIYLKDTQGHFILCNTPVAVNAGCASPDDIIGKTDFDFYPHDTAERFFSDEQLILASADALINHEEQYLDKNTHETKWNLTTKVPIKDDADKIVGLMGINRDITHMKNALLEREKTMSDLLQRNSDLEQFTYIVSHNLRLPVANILGLVDLVSDNSDIDKEDTKRVLRAIAESAKKLDTIIHDLNHILQVRELVNEHKENINLEILIDNVKKSVRKVLDKQKVKIECKFDIPEIISIQSYLFSIFYNLILNSIKYCKPKIKPVISIAVKIVGDSVQFVFADNGRGIDLKANGQQLFGLYRTFNPEVEGKGTGLFIVKTQVELLGGTVSVQSELGKGTIFTILIPLKQ